MSGVGMSGVLQGCSIKVAVVMLDEVGDGAECGHKKMMKDELGIMKDETLRSHKPESDRLQQIDVPIKKPLRLLT
jgi:hypothetical protein